MCGIAGLIGKRGQPIDPDIVRRMCATLIHRGPDDEGIHGPAPHVVFGHRRLSIIDVDGGQQPLCNEDGTVWITFNGEIFNYRELRAELEGKGHRFKTRSDTEVIVHLYEELGPRCVERLNGQFGFALWDGEQLFCARDPIGIKPLYYYEDDDHFAVASEPRAFFAVPEADLSIDLEAILHYFRFHFIPSPYSSYRRVRKLRPGEWLTLSRDGAIRRQRYWDLTETVEDLADEAQALQLVRDDLDTAVERQMVSDVPIGAFLSGGVDSSTVVAMMQRHATEPVRTFTMGFPEKDEREYARQVAEWVGTDYREAVVGHEEAGALIPRLFANMDEPMGDASLIPTHAVSCLAREHSKVALAGDGGDELLAGYGRHRRVLDYLTASPLLRPFWSWAGRRARRSTDPTRLTGLDTRNIGGWSRQILAELSDERPGRFYGPALADRAREGVADPMREEIDLYAHLPPVAQVLAVDMQTNLSDRLLTKVDRAAMWTSLEVRVPLLDVDFVRTVFRLSPTMRLYGGRRSKAILDAALPDALPPCVHSRKKKGFGPPVKYWFARGLSDWVHEQLHHSIAVEEGLLDRRAVDALVTPERIRGKVRGSTVWRVLALEAWLRNVREGRLAMESRTAAPLRELATAAPA